MRPAALPIRCTSTAATADSTVIHGSQSRATLGTGDHCVPRIAKYDTRKPATTASSDAGACRRAAREAASTASATPEGATALFRTSGRKNDISGMGKLLGGRTGREAGAPRRPYCLTPSMLMRRSTSSVAAPGTPYFMPKSVRLMVPLAT